MVVDNATREATIEARADNLAALDRAALNKTTHGIAARIDKMSWSLAEKVDVVVWRRDFC